jgi:hypothetical protein
MRRVFIVSLVAILFGMMAINKFSLTPVPTPPIVH